MENVQIEGIQAIEYPSNFEGLIIHLNSSEGMTRDIMIVLNTKNVDQVYPFLRLHNLTSSFPNKNISYSGEVKWVNRYGEILNKTIIEKNQIKTLGIFDSGKNSKFYPGVTCSWKCSDQAFNSYYQAYKKQCEKDWLCDTACDLVGTYSINYIFNAVKQCFTCGIQQPQYLTGNKM